MMALRWNSQHGGVFVDGSHFCVSHSSTSFCFLLSITVGLYFTQRINEKRTGMHTLHECLLTYDPTNKHEKLTSNFLLSYCRFLVIHPAASTRVGG